MMHLFVVSKPLSNLLTSNHRKTSVLSFLVQGALGGLFLGLCSQMRIPFYPVPMTLQTLGVFILAITQGGKKSSLSGLFYLTYLTFGAPFLASVGNPMLWYASPVFGYLLSFPIAAYVMGTMFEKSTRCTFVSSILKIASGQFIIYTLGICGLLNTFSLSYSLYYGFLLFIPSMIVKALIASKIAKISFNKKMLGS